VVNQIDLHPFMRHPDIVEICEKNNIVLEVSLAFNILTVTITMFQWLSAAPTGGRDLR